MDKKFTPWLKNVKMLPYAVEAGKGNYGISADIDGVHKISTVALNDCMRWINASTSDKPLVAIMLAYKIFKKEMAALEKKYGETQSLADMINHFWKSTGRKGENCPVEMYIVDKKLFKTEEEVEIPFYIFDGFAVGTFESKQYIMHYPTVKEVMKSKSKYQQVENYCGQRVMDTGVYPEDIALTFGVIEKGIQW